MPKTMNIRGNQDENIYCFLRNSFDFKIYHLNISEYSKKYHRYFSQKTEEDTESTVNPPIWKCFCSKCGAKGRIHRFEGKKYCSNCLYELMKEKILREHQNTNQD